MKFIEESYGRDFYEQLSQVSTAKGPVKVVMSGAGVHWDVTAEIGSRICIAHCFDVQGPEYLISFQQADQAAAMGRTSSNADAIAAIVVWLEGKELSGLHARFSFVDGQKRALENIRAEVFRHCPELQRCGFAELSHKACDLYDL